MIKITNLTKVYKTKRRKLCCALNNVNLTLANNGLVFILGKSGSGKSTLLNLIGGLDSITSGKIEVNGNDISAFSERESCNYRNSQLGFIFQDYHLIDELSVYDNIALSLNLLKLEDDGDIKRALEKVDLAGYENRYPTELSGGERQRVAIARALVKNPSVILADEPTGNLDTNTATAIVQLLQELSKECLIVIVSHNRNDANRYADRIIELSRGEVINDVSLNPEFVNAVTVEKDKLFYPEGLALTACDVELINNNKHATLVKKSDKYLPSKKIEITEENKKIQKTTLSFKKSLDLSKKFLKSKLFAITASAFMIAVIMVIMALAQTIISFNAGKVMAQELKQMGTSAITVNSFISEETKLKLGQNSKDYYSNITNEQIQKFTNAGYSGEIHKIYNHFLPIENGYSQPCAGWLATSVLRSVYPNITLGTMVVTSEFLQKQFGELTYLAVAENPHPSGVYITDYLADAIFSVNKMYITKQKDYANLIGDYEWAAAAYGVRGYINGVIHTGYKERYKSLIEKFTKGELKNISDLTKEPLFISLSDEVFGSLGYTYSLNPNFETDFYQTPSVQAVYHYAINVNGVTYYPSAPNVRDGKDFKMELTGNQIVVNMARYNEMFGTEYTSATIKNFVPHTAKIEQFYYFDVERKNSLYKGEVEIVKLVSSTGGGATFYASTQLFNELLKNSLFTVGLHFYGSNGLDKVIDLSSELGFTQNTLVIDAIHTMTRAVEVFIPIFELVAIFLCVGVIFILISFASKMINNKMHDIGILKALGTQNGSVFAVFGVQVLLIALLTCLLASLGYYLFIGLANDVLIKSLVTLAPARIMLDLDFLTFKPIIAVINCALVAVFSVLSLIVPMVKIKRIKPVQIIKSKE